MSAYHHGRLRGALVEAARILVATRGVDGFSLREAAREVGVTASAAYRHFPDKAALLAAVAEDGFTELARATAEAYRASPDPVEAFHAVGLSYVEFAVAQPERFRVAFGPYGVGVKLAGETPYELFVSALDGLVAAKIVSAARRADAELPAWSAVHGLASLLIDGRVRLTPQERQRETRRLVEFVLAALGGPVGREPG